MSQLACRMVRIDISFADYDNDYGNTRFLKRYMADNNNTVDIKLEWILKWYRVNNNNTDGTELDENATVF